MLRIEISEEEYLTLFSLIYQSTKMYKLQEFQYKILNSAVVTNIKLKKWGITNSDSCTFCDNEPESLMHLMLHCDVSKQVWEYVLLQVSHKLGLGIRFSDAEIILGINSDIPEKYILTQIFMIVKYYLYASRCLKNIPSGNLAIQKIRDVRTIEHEIAIKNNGVPKFTDRWDSLITL